MNDANKDRPDCDQFREPGQAASSGQSGGQPAVQVPNGACADRQSQWGQRCAAALDLTPDERFAIAQSFFSSFPGGDTSGPGYGQALLDFMTWEYKSGRWNPNDPNSKWWRVSNGEMVLDMGNAQRLLEQGQTHSDVPGVQKWIDYALTARKGSNASSNEVQSALWTAHQTSLHEGIHMASNYYSELTKKHPGEAMFAGTVVEDVDVAAIHNLGTSAFKDRLILADSTFYLYWHAMTMGAPTSLDDAERIDFTARSARKSAFGPDPTNIGVNSSQWDT
jgi:hypothetical protein